MQTERIILRHSEPVASGSRHLIFQHPSAVDLLVKIHRPAAAPRWYKLHRRLYGPAIGFTREIREQLLVWSRCNEHPEFLNRIVGICETDLGIGMMVQRLDDESGSLAENLTTMIDRGKFDAEKKTALAAFLDRLLASPLYFDDLHAANIVYAFDRKRGRYHFVLVDGIGHKTLIPVARFIPFLENRRRKGQLALLINEIAYVESRAHAAQKA